MTNSRTKPKIRIHWQTIKKFKKRIREITSRRRGRSLVQTIRELNKYFKGWWNYFRLTESKNRLQPIDHWIRQRLGALIWKRWKNRRTRGSELLKRGITRFYALRTGCAREGPWRMGNVKWVNTCRRAVCGGQVKDMVQVSRYAAE